RLLPGDRQVVGRGVRGRASSHQRLGGFRLLRARQLPRHRSRGDRGHGSGDRDRPVPAGRPRRPPRARRVAHLGAADPVALTLRSRGGSLRPLALRAARRAGTSAAGQERRAAPREERLAKVTVLIADDLKFFLEIEKSYLRRGGFEVLTATSGEEAVEVARRRQPHLVLL